MSNYCPIEDAYNGLYLKEPVELDILKKGTQLFGYIKINKKEVGKIGFNIVKLPEKQIDIMMEEILHSGVLESDSIHYITFPIDSKKSSYYVTLTLWNTMSGPSNLDNRQFELQFPGMGKPLVEKRDYVELDKRDRQLRDVENSLTSTKSTLKQNKPIKEKDLKFVFNCSGVLKKQKKEKKDRETNKTVAENYRDAQSKRDLEQKQIIPDVPDFKDPSPVCRMGFARKKIDSESKLKQTMPDVPEHCLNMKCEKLNEEQCHETSVKNDIILYAHRPIDISSYDILCKHCYEAFTREPLLLSILVKSVRCGFCERIVKNEAVYDKKTCDLKTQDKERTLSLDRVRDHNPNAYDIIRDKVEKVHNLTTNKEQSENDLRNTEQEENKGSYLDYFGIY